MKRIWKALMFVPFFLIAGTVMHLNGGSGSEGPYGGFLKKASFIDDARADECGKECVWRYTHWPPPPFPFHAWHCDPSDPENLCDIQGSPRTGTCSTTYEPEICNT